MRKISRLTAPLALSFLGACATAPEKSQATEETMRAAISLARMQGLETTLMCKNVNRGGILSYSAQHSAYVLNLIEGTKGDGEIAQVSGRQDQKAFDAMAQKLNKHCFPR